MFGVSYFQLDVEYSNSDSVVHQHESEVRHRVLSVHVRQTGLFRKLDHIHTPDPVMLEIEELKRRMALLEQQINDVQKEN